MGMSRSRMPEFTTECTKVAQRATKRKLIDFCFIVTVRATFVSCGESLSLTPLSDQSLRWRLDGILSILRYFVTVRRATG